MLILGIQTATGRRREGRTVEVRRENIQIVRLAPARLVLISMGGEAPAVDRPPLVSKRAVAVADLNELTNKEAALVGVRDAVEFTV